MERKFTRLFVTILLTGFFVIGTTSSIAAMQIGEMFLQQISQIFLQP